MFANDTTETVTIGDVIVTIKKLSWKSLRKAAEAQQDASIAIAAKAGETVIKAWNDTASREQAAAKPGAKYARYDRSVILQAGVKSWTAENRKLPQALDELDEASAEQLHRAILDLSLPKEAEAEEADRKNA